MKTYDVIFSAIDTHEFTWREVVHLAHTSKEEWIKLGAELHHIEALDEFDAAIIARITSLGKDITSETRTKAEAEIRKHTGAAMEKGGYKDAYNNSRIFVWGPKYADRIVVFEKN